MTYYLVICNNKRGAYAPEQDVRDMTSVGKLVIDICAGQYGNIAQIFEFDPVRRTSADCTADIARDCAAFLAEKNREPISRALFDFIDSNLANHGLKMAA